jgi:hypothetical protein
MSGRYGSITFRKESIMTTLTRPPGPRPRPSTATQAFRTLAELLDLAETAEGRLPGLMGYPGQLRHRYSDVTVAPPADRRPCASCGSTSSTLVDGVPLHVSCPDPEPAELARLAAATPAEAATAVGQDSPAPPVPAGQQQLLAAVLAGDGLWIPGATAPVEVNWPRNVAEAYALADEHRIRQLWIHPSAHQHLGLPDAHGDNPQAPEQHPWMTGPGLECDPPGLAAWVNLRPAGGDRRRALVFTLYERADRANWKKASSGQVLRDAVETFNGQMPRGCGYYYSPNETSAAVIRHHDRGNLTLVDVPPPAAGRIRHISRWSRPLGSLEEGATWLHAYDVNAQQLAVWNTKLGQGQAEHRVSPPWTPACRRMPGYWLTQLPAAWRPDLSLPDLLQPWTRTGEETVWLPTPYLELLDELGAPIAVDEAWVWPVSSAWLEAAGKTFRNARAALTGRDDEPAAIALTVIKQIYASRVGAFRPHDLDTARPDPLIRPDVRDAFISKSFCNDYRRTRKIGAASGRWPVAIYADAVYYASEDPDPVKSAPAGLTLGSGLGQYKVVHSVPVGVVADELGQPGFQRAIERYRRGPR